ncbi:hypothetical protein C8R44DRAFT_736942 [Mycena epipterygia]|nr:hypothetical protein C8R44DRAFT_736942 [Mycena epipterygia]
MACGENVGRRMQKTKAQKLKREIWTGRRWQTDLEKASDGALERTQEELRILRDRPASRRAVLDAVCVRKKAGREQTRFAIHERGRANRSTRRVGRTPTAESNYCACAWHTAARAIGGMLMAKSACGIGIRKVLIGDGWAEARVRVTSTAALARRRVARDASLAIGSD